MKEKRFYKLIHKTYMAVVLQTWHENMRGDGATAGCHVVIWSSVTITQSFRLHFHPLKLHSGKLLTEIVKF